MKKRVTNRDNVETEISGAEGEIVMSAIKSSGFDELMALCGGARSCATCHVIIDPEFVSLMPAMTEDEDDRLDASDHRTANSRLSCQIMCSEVLDGLRLIIAPED